MHPLFENNRSHHLLVKYAYKLTFGQSLEIATLHPIEGVLKEPPGKWLSNARLTHFHGLLLNSPRIKFYAVTVLILATLVLVLGQEVVYNCQEVLAQHLQIRPDLKDIPLPNCQLQWHMDGSNFLKDGVRKAEATVVS